MVKTRLFPEGGYYHAPGPDTYWWCEEIVRFEGKPCALLQRCVKVNGRIYIADKAKLEPYGMKGLEVYQRVAHDGGPLFNDDMEQPTLRSLITQEDLVAAEDWEYPSDKPIEGGSEMGSW